MNENSDLLPNLLHEEFEMQMRGYSRRQVDDFVARRNNEIRELEQRLTRTLDDTEQLRLELSTVRQQALAGRPAHEEISERISQILKLADDEAKAQKNTADDAIGKQLAEAQQESERVRADAREQAERMLTAAQEQAERTISAARADADTTRTTARADADRLTSETRKKADAALAQAKAQAKKVLDEATARATAIHDGAERRLNLLSTRHAETVRRLSDILDGVQGLVTAESARLSLVDEVNETASRAISLAAAQDASAQPDDETSEGDPDLAMLAPPALETLSAGTAAPPRGDNGRPDAPAAAPGRHSGRESMPAAPGSPYDRFEGSVPVGSGITQPGSATDRTGRPGPGQPPQAERPGRAGGSQPDAGLQRSALPAPGHGPSGRGLGDSFTERETKREQPSQTGLIDPDEPTEGLRLLP